MCIRDRSYFVKYPKEIAAARLGSNWNMLKTNLRRIRKAGVCIARGEVDKGVVGIAGPVLGPNNAVLGAITMALSHSDATPQLVASISILVQAAGRELSSGLALLSRQENSAR